MIPLPQIQIRQQYAQIDIQVERGRLDMKKPVNTIDMTSTPSKLEVESYPATLDIDQSRARGALTGGTMTEWNDRIYSQMKDIAIQAIKERVERGNRMAAIHIKGNPIADMAWEQMNEGYPVEYCGPVSYDPVDIHFEARKPDIRITPGTLDISAPPRQMEISYEPGKVDIYLKQKASLEIIPPQIDFRT